MKPDAREKNNPMRTIHLSPLEPYLYSSMKGIYGFAGGAGFLAFLPQHPVLVGAAGVFFSSSGALPFAADLNLFGSKMSEALFMKPAMAPASSP